MPSPLCKYAPLPLWLKEYQVPNLSHDLIAGIIVTLLVIPQSLAYALLAGLPPHYGLYVSTLPVMAYALFGSSTIQAVGPVALTAMLTFSFLSPYAEPQTDHYVHLAAALSFFSGALLLLFGFLRLGFLARLLSAPVVSGFISGSSLLIAATQLKFLLGLRVEDNRLWSVLDALWQQFSQLHGMTVCFGLLAFVILLLVRTRLAKCLVYLGLGVKNAALIVRLMPLCVVLSSLLMVRYGGVPAFSELAVVGPITEGLPAVTLFIPKLQDLQLLLMPILFMTLIGMVQNISMAQALAAKEQKRILPNDELRALGTANICAAFYGMMPVGGGVSRSAINMGAGAKTPLASLISSALMLGVIAGAAHWFEALPLTVLSANIMVSAIFMVEVTPFLTAWRYDKADAIALLSTAFCVMAIGPAEGIALGVCLSLGVLLYRASSPRLSMLARRVGTEHFVRKVEDLKEPNLEELASVLFIRIDENLFFGNLDVIESKLRALLARSDPKITDLVLVMSSVNHIDTSGLGFLNTFNEQLKSQGVLLHIAHLKSPLKERLLHPFLAHLSGRLFLSAHEAFEALKDG